MSVKLTLRRYCCGASIPPADAWEKSVTGSLGWLIIGIFANLGCVKSLSSEVTVLATFAAGVLMPLFLPGYSVVWRMKSLD